MEVLSFKATMFVKFIYSEKATKFSKISTIYLTVTTKDKSTVEILQKFVVFTEYINSSMAFSHEFKLILNTALNLFSFT